jgi:hypothetical protein
MSVDREKLSKTHRDSYRMRTYHFSTSLEADSGHRAELRSNAEGRLDPGYRGGSEGSGRASEDGDGCDGFHIDLGKDGIYKYNMTLEITPMSHIDRKSIPYPIY